MKHQLGKALKNSRFGKKIIHSDGSTRHTTEIITSMEYSITEENDLEAFLNNAKLADTDFTAERLNVSVVEKPNFNPFLLSPEKEAEILILNAENEDKLIIPRRPAWDKTTTAEQLQLAERNSFLNWRRSLAVLEEEKGLLMTPYERNLEIWRQLWRVTERSDLIVQIVDARNPQLFRCEDLETFVKETDPNRKNLLLVNKADMLSARQRTAWADYYDNLGVAFRFFSAELSKKQQEAEKLLSDPEFKASELVLETTYLDQEDNVPERIRILNAHELFDILKKECPKSIRKDDPQAKVTIGFVGYPNVGKSSTLNALVGAHKVAVGATPGKTKHFQTIHLSDMVLCDCPGLVFPSFATTKADMVCNGILPIDQLREYVGPAGLVAQRIPKGIVEAVYGIKIATKDEAGSEVDRQPTAAELLCAYAVARGFTKASQGNPDEARAARIILKDYVRGKLLFVHPPSGYDATEFNQELYNNERYIKSKMKEALLLEKTVASPNETPTTDMNDMDVDFFIEKTVRAKTVGKFPSKDFSRPVLIPTAETNEAILPSKKSHKKGKKNIKMRTEWTAI